MSTDNKSNKQTRRSNPLEGSSLLSSASVEPPPLPSLLTTSVAPATLPQSVEPSVKEETGQSSLLYRGKRTAEFRLRPFEQQYDRQTIYIDAYLAGAVDALVQLVAGGNKTRFVNEMVHEMVKKYDHLLQENEELVKLCEEKYRKKHRL